jgi:hypothetical protein
VFLATACGFLAFLQMVVMVFRYSSPIPISDYWWFFKDIRDHGEFPPLSWYWHQHEGMPHRIPLLRLFLVADWWLAAGTSRLIIAASFTAQLAHAALAIVWISRNSGGSTIIRNAAAALLTFALFMPQQWENFILGFQLAFTLWMLFGFLALRDAVEDRPLAANLYAIGASLNVVGAVLLWPVMLVITWVRGRSIRRLALAVAVPVGFVTIFLYGLKTETTLASPTVILEFFLRFFAQPFVRPDSPAAIWLGSTILAVGLFNVLRILRRIIRNEDSPGDLELLIAASIAYLMLAIGVISFGRAVLGYANRYQTPALLFWAWTTLSLVVWKVRTPGVWAPWLVAFVTLAVVQAPDAVELAEHTYANRNVSGATFAANVIETDSPGVFWLNLGNWLRERHKSMWRSEPFSKIGQVWSDQSTTTAAADCVSLNPMLAVKLPGGGWKIEGSSSQGNDFVYLVRETDRTIVGVAAKTWSKPPNLQIIGYVPEESTGKTIRAAASGCLSRNSLELKTAQ